MPYASKRPDEASESLFVLPGVLASQSGASDNLARALESLARVFHSLVGSPTPN